MININGLVLSTGKFLEENLVESALKQTLGDKFTFQQENNLNHNEMLTKTTLNVPELPSYSFDLNRLENLWQSCQMAVKQ